MWDSITHSVLLLQAGFACLIDNLPFFSLLLLGQLVFSAPIANMLSKADLDRDLVSTLSFLGGILTLSTLSLTLAWLKIKPAPGFLPVFIILLLLVAIGQKKQYRVILTPALGWMILFFLFILGVRLIFIQNLLVPPYADSIQHVQIVEDILSPEEPARAFYQLSGGPAKYYHFGFHALAGWMGGILGKDASQSVLLLGQYFQALAIFGLFPLAHIILRGSDPAWLTVLISGLFLPVPAYFSNWGKYPALASMSGVLFTVTLFIIFFENRARGNHLNRKFHLLIFLAVLGTAALHTRALIILLIGLLLGLAALRFTHAKINPSPGIFIVVATTLGLDLASLLTLNLPLPPLFYVFLLTCVTLSFYTDFIPALLMHAFFLCLGVISLLPIPNLVRGNTLLDQPFLAICSFIPISIFIGFAARWLFNLQPGWRQRGLLALVFVGVFFTIFVQGHQPTDCCIFMDDDDLFSFAWIEQNISKEGTLIGVAASVEPGSFLFSDGGGWIEPLTGFPTRKLAYTTDFSIENRALCKSGVTHVYVDGISNSFNASTLLAANAQALFSLGQVSIYRLNCE